MAAAAQAEDVRPDEAADAGDSGDGEVVVWVGRHGADPVKLRVPADGHVADVRQLAAQRLKFSGRAVVEDELCVRSEDGTKLPTQTPVAELPSGVLLVEERNEVNSLVASDLLHSLGHAADMVDESGYPRRAHSMPVRDVEAGAAPRGQTWAGGCLPEGDEEDEKEEEEAMPARRANQSWAGHGDEDDDAPSGLPSRRPQTWHGGVGDDVIDGDDDEEGPAAKDPPAQATPGPADVCPPSAPPEWLPGATGWAMDLGLGGSLQVDTTGDGRADTVLFDTTGDGMADLARPLPPLVEDPGTPGLAAAGTPMLPRPPTATPMYIDRIPVNVSDRMLTKAINEQLSPRGVDKVTSLEVIRNQVTPHCHAFAFLKSQPKRRDMVSLTVARDRGTETTFGTASDRGRDVDEIRVQPSREARTVPQAPTPRSTLHIRIYARKREAWAANVVKMQWAGLLGLLEIVSPGCTKQVRIVADDKSRKNNRVHRSVLLCAFFAECESVEAAIALREKVHDHRADCHGVTFLIHTDFTKLDKRLHDTCRRREVLQRQFDRAQQSAQRLSGPGGSQLLLAGSDYFEFSDGFRPPGAGHHPHTQHPTQPMPEYAFTCPPGFAWDMPPAQFGYQIFGGMGMPPSGPFGPVPPIHDQLSGLPHMMPPAMITPCGVQRPAGPSG